MILASGAKGDGRVFPSCSVFKKNLGLICAPLVFCYPNRAKNVCLFVKFSFSFFFSVFFSCLWRLELLFSLTDIQYFLHNEV